MADLPEPDRVSNIIPFGAVEEADVKLDPIITGGTEEYIDDGAVVVLDSESNKPMVKRAQQAVPMGLYLTFRPLAGKDEPIQCPHPASIRKMIAEDQLRKTITFLGWFINTRLFTISLPTKK